MVTMMVVMVMMVAVMGSLAAGTLAAVVEWEGVQQRFSISQATTLSQACINF